METTLEGVVTFFQSNPWALMTVIGAAILWALIWAVKVSAH